MTSSNDYKQQQHSFNSPLGFLQAALPHVSTKDLIGALEDIRLEGSIDGHEEVGVDMWDVIAGILTKETIREMEERGVGGLDDDGSIGLVEDDDERRWETVEKIKKKPHPATNNKKRNNTRGKTIVLGDLRQQQQQIQEGRRRYDNQTRPRSSSAPDPWTRLSSLSSYLASLLPPHPPSFFQSYFHSASHASPYIALCACLKSITQSAPGKVSTDTDEYINASIGLMDILLPQEGQDSSFEHPQEQQLQSQVVLDIELALQVTGGRGDNALDLVRLLRELDTDSTMGVYHSPPQSPQMGELRPGTAPTPNPRVVIPPKNLISSEWQSVPHRRRSSTTSQGQLSPLAAFIPAYARDPVKKAATKAATGYNFREGGSDPNVNRYQKQMRESIQKRDELLKQATRVWQSGNSKTRGGEAALYYAERAREFQEQAKKDALMAARTMVEAKRVASGDHNSIDLHGTTVAEAITIVKETLEARDVSQSKPLKIITGRGAHSVNQVGVLKPAIKRALEEDGWIVGLWHGGLDIRGRA